MSISPDNIAQHLTSFGYSAKAGTITDKDTGQPVPVVFVNGLGSINAYLNLSEDPRKFGLKIFGNLQPGYAPVILDEQGDVIRERVRQNGETITRAKRGEPLDQPGLKAKNNEISLSARREITGAVLAAYMLEVGGGDLELIRDGFRLQKWERSQHRPVIDADGTDESAATAEAGASFSKAATQQQPNPRYKRAQGPEVS